MNPELPGELARLRREQFLVRFDTGNSSKTVARVAQLHEGEYLLLRFFWICCLFNGMDT